MDPSPSSTGPVTMNNERPRAVTLDPLSYPHIIDDIFRFAPREALINLRLVSKAFLAKADAILAYNVTFSPGRHYLNCGGVVPREVKRRYPRPLNGHIPPPVPGLPWEDFFEPGETPQNPWQSDAKSVERYATIIANTRVAGFSSQYCTWGPQSYCNHTAEVARVCRALIKVDTLCLGISCGAMPFGPPIRARRVIVGVSRLLVDYREVPGLCGPTCYGVQHLVLYMYGSSAEVPIPVQAISALWSPSLRDLTVIFNIERCFRKLEEQPLGILTELVWLIAVSIPTVKVKVVICRSVTRRLLGDQEQAPCSYDLPMTEDEVRQRIFLGILDVLFPHSPTEDDIRSCECLFDDSFTFLTLEAYRSSTPAANFELETLGDFDDELCPDQTYRPRMPTWDSEDSATPASVDQWNGSEGEEVVGGEDAVMDESMPADDDAAEDLGENDYWAENRHEDEGLDERVGQVRDVRDREVDECDGMGRIQQDGQTRRLGVWARMRNKWELRWRA